MFSHYPIYSLVDQIYLDHVGQTIVFNHIIMQNLGEIQAKKVIRISIIVVLLCLRMHSVLYIRLMLLQI